MPRCVKALGHPPCAQQGREGEADDMVGDAHSDDRDGCCYLGRTTCLMTCTPKPPEHKGREGQRQTLVCELGAREQEHWVGGIHETGASRCPTGSSDTLCDKEERHTEENACRTDKDNARREDAEAAQIREACRDRCQPWVVSGGGQQRVELEEMSGAKDVLGIADG